MALPRRISETVSYPLNFQEAADYLRSDADQDSSEGRVILKAIRAAAARVEQYTGLILSAGEYEWTVDEWWKCDLLELPFRPFGELVSVSYLDASNQLTVLGANDYQQVQVNSITGGVRLLLDQGPELYTIPKGRRSPGLVKIRFKAGYANPDLIPQDLVHAMLLYVGSYFDERTDLADEKTRLSETLMQSHVWPVIA